MIKSKLVQRDIRPLIKLQRVVDDRTMSAVRAIANMIVRDIKSHWSASSPSRPFNPPAIKTGNLDSSIEIERQGRDLLGRFAGKDAEVLFIQFDTSKGDDPQGRGQYAGYLESGTSNMKKRPYLEPALERASKLQGFYYKKEGIFKL